MIQKEKGKVVFSKNKKAPDILAEIEGIIGQDMFTLSQKGKDLMLYGVVRNLLYLSADGIVIRKENNASNS